MTDDPLLRPLIELSDRFIVDSADQSDPEEALRQLRAAVQDPSWKGNAGDLAWVRVEPWRELVASFFDPVDLRGHLDGITSVHIRAGGPSGRAGFTAAGAYLAGWLASRLGWTGRVLDGRLRRTDGRAVLVRLTHDPAAEPGSIGAVRIESLDARRPAAFIAERIASDRPLVRVAIEMEGSCPLPQVQRLDRMEPFAVLCGELQRDGHDPAFEEAVVAAAGS